VPGYGVACFPQRSRGRRSAPPDPVHVGNWSLSNARVAVTVLPDGRVTLADQATGTSIGRLLVWDSRTDLGDLYTPSVREKRLTPSFRGARVVHRGPVRGTIETRWRLASGRQRIDVTVTLMLDAGAPFVRVGVSGTNAVPDHRLRLGFATGVAQPTVVADAMFGPIERKPVAVTDEERRFETPLPTAPLHRYVSLFAPHRGVTVFSDGLAEYEAGDDGTVFITLCRAVGELSRNDLPERPGHAGWPTPTPEAHCIGAFGAEFAVMAHGPRDPATLDAIERTVDDVLLPLTGATLRSAIAPQTPASSVALLGVGLSVSTVTLGQDGESLVLRCVNVTDTEQAGSWNVTPPHVSAQLARLDETPLGPLAVNGTAIAFRAAPRAVVTVLVR
jgi:alpha-mannosidase